MGTQAHGIWDVDTSTILGFSAVQLTRARHLGAEDDHLDWSADLLDAAMG